MTIRLAAFHHEALNLNGDIQNLAVLSLRLNALGFDCEVLELNGSNFEVELSKGIDFVLIGHGSAAAWAAIATRDSDFESAVLATADRAIPLLAIASGFEKCVEFGLFDTALVRQERRSEFVNFEWQSFELIGYLNSDSGLPPFAQQGVSYGSLLHGPLLAKNPKLADHFIRLILDARKLQPSDSMPEKVQKLDEIADLARSVAKEMMSS